MPPTLRFSLLLDRGGGAWICLPDLPRCGEPLSVLLPNSIALGLGAGSRLRSKMPDAAPAQGTATFARVLRRDGGEVFSCDVGDLKSDAVIKLSTTTIAAGSPVRLDSFVLSLP